MASGLSPDLIRPPRRAEPSIVAGSHLGRFVDTTGRPDTDAFLAVFDRHADHLHRKACRIAGPMLATEVVEIVITDIGRRPERFDVDDARLLSLLEADVRRHALGALIVTDSPGLAERFGPTMAAAVASLPTDDRGLIALAATGRYTTRTLSALLGQPPSILAGRIYESLARLRAWSSPTGGGLAESDTPIGSDRATRGRLEPCR